MIVQYQLTLEIFMALQRNSIHTLNYHKRRQQLSNIMMSILVFCLGFLFTKLLLSSLVAEELIFSLALTGGIFLALALMPFVKRIYPYVTIWQFRYFLKNDLRFPTNVTLVINETEIIITSKQNLVTSQKNISWESINKLSEDDSYYYLYVEEDDAIIVPKHNDESSILELKPFQLLLKSKLVN